MSSSSKLERSSSVLTFLLTRNGAAPVISMAFWVLYKAEVAEARVWARAILKKVSSSWVIYDYY